MNPIPESLVIKQHDIVQRRCGTVMEVRRASRKSAQDRSLNLANIGALSGDHRSTQVGDLVGRSGIRSRITEYGKDRQVINIKGLDGPIPVAASKGPALAISILIGNFTEWLPTFGES